MHGILFDFIYWLNSNILSFSDGITIPQKSLFLYIFYETKVNFLF